jgi:hypothetical protein
MSFLSKDSGAIQQMETAFTITPSNEQLSPIKARWEMFLGSLKGYIEERTLLMKNCYPFFGQDGPLQDFRQEIKKYRLEWMAAIQWARDKRVALNRGKSSTLRMDDGLAWIRSIPPCSPDSWIRSSPLNSKQCSLQLPEHRQFVIDMEFRRNGLCDLLRQQQQELLTWKSLIDNYGKGK